MKTPPGKDEEAQRIGQLIALYIQGVIGPEEHDELDAWVAQSDENMRLFEELTDEKNIERGLAEMQRADWKEHSAKLLEIAARKQKSRPSLRNWLIAASVIFLSGFGWWYLSKNNTDKEKPLLAYREQADKAPGSHKALLTLGNGNTVALDSGQNGNLAIEGNVQVMKTDTSLLYNSLPKAGIAESIVYNKLSTPKGGMYALVLADGTKVWLNAASFIYYPTAFTQKERRVKIGGEAYFEVASFKKSGTKRPFIVRVNGIEVEVLGTHFNVNAYPEEEGSTVTLLEGAVKISKGAATRLLQPGQMATIDKASDAIVIKKADGADPVGWKEGLFVFNDADIGSIARQLARWYDVEVDIKDPVTEHLNATIPRTLALSKVAHLLEKMGLVHFTLSEGKLQIHK